MSWGYLHMIINHFPIVGAIIGAHVGVEGIPEEWRTFRDEYQEPMSLGEQLYDLVKEEMYIPPDPAETY